MIAKGFKNFDMKISKSTLFAALSIASSVTMANDLVLIGKTEEYKFYAGPSEAATRVGKAYLGWIHVVSDGAVWSHKIMFDCGGQWISDSVDVQGDLEGKDPVSSMYQATRSKPQLMHDVVQVKNWNESEFGFKDFLKLRVKQLCSSVKEKKGHEVTFAATSFSKKQISRAYSLKSGEFSKANGIIDGWIAIKNYTKELRNDAQGNLYRDPQGEPVEFIIDADDGSELNKVAINCEGKKIDVYKKVKYDQSGAVDRKKSYDYPFRSSDMKEVVPDSIGAAMLDFICLAYK